MSFQDTSSINGRITIRYWNYLHTGSNSRKYFLSSNFFLLNSSSEQQQTTGFRQKRSSLRAWRHWWTTPKSRNESVFFSIYSLGASAAASQNCSKILINFFSFRLFRLSKVLKYKLAVSHQVLASIISLNILCA